MSFARLNQQNIQKEKTAAVINVIAGNLSDYLNKCIYTLDDRQQKYSVKYKNKFVTASAGFCDPALSSKRIANILEIRDELNKMLSLLSAEDKVNNGTKPEDVMLKEIENLLIQGKNKNNQFSNEHGFIHRSYLDNRLTGQGVFSSWWNKTIFQSRANTALEKSLEDLNKFTSTLTKSTSMTHKKL